MNAIDTLKKHVRTVPDWPLPGIQFRDITPLLQNAQVFQTLIGCFVERYQQPALRPQVVAGLDARGFIMGAAVAHALGLGFVPIRKKGKLPFHTLQESYELEYGSATVELHTDAVSAGQRVLLMDDLVATGGTMLAGARLLRKLGAEIVETTAIIDIPDLGGSRQLQANELPFYSLLTYPGH